MGASVLVIDDEPKIRSMLSEMLGLVGYNVYEAADGVDGLEKAIEHHPDAIILDVMMPRMDGLTMCRELRQNPAMAELPVIMVSGKTDFGAEQAGLDAGANKYFFKPIGMGDLVSSLRELISSG